MYINEEYLEDESDMKKWYAVKKDRDDTDISKGSRNRAEAEKMARSLGKDAFIAVMDDNDPPVCVEEITQDTFETE